VTQVALGDGVNLDHAVYDRDGQLTNATVAIAVTRPSGTTFTAPAISTTSTGRYRAATFVPDETGVWTVEWSVTGTVTDKTRIKFTVTALGAVALGGPYALVPQLKSRLGIPDSNSARDSELATRLASAAADINRWCHRQFGRQEEATTRKFHLGRTGLDVHDFWSLEDLAITPYSMGLPGTAWDVATVIVEPFDGVVDQVPGWPFTRISYPHGDHPLARALYYNNQGAEVRVTARWGWEAVPESITTANLMLAAMDDKARDAPFGVAGFGDYAMRIRTNPMVEEKLKPYVKDGPGLEVGS
jgi:hypothetical protein